MYDLDSTGLFNSSKLQAKKRLKSIYSSQVSILKKLIGIGLKYFCSDVQ